MFALHIFISLALALQRLARRFVRLIALARRSRSGSLEPILCIFYTELFSFYVPQGIVTHGRDSA
jgi:hypothetical protein